MDVRLPDGTIIQNVPDGISRADLTAKLAANGYDTSKLGGPAAQPAQPAAPATAGSRVQSAVAGVNKGFFSDLLGLPVDTAANVLDLAKMGLGAGYQAISGKTAPDWTLPYDRSKVPGTAEWIARQVNNAGLGATINNPHPEDAASRILHTGGRMAGASVLPVKGLTLKQQAVNMAKGAVSGTVSGSVGEVAPEWAGLAAMTPQAMEAGVPAAMRGMAGPNMAQRIADLKAGGIDNPSLGLATGNKFISGLENLLSQTPGSVGLFDRAREANVAGMQAKTAALRDAISPDYGPVAAGAAIQSDLKTSFPARINATARTLNDKVANLIGQGTLVPIDNTLGKAAQLTTPIKGAEATSGELILPRIKTLADNLRTDVYGPQANPAPTIRAGNPTANWPVSQASAPNANPSLWNAPDPEQVANSSLWNLPTVPNAPLPLRGAGPIAPGAPFASLMNAQKTPGLPYGALKALRTSIGEEAASNAIVGTPEQGQFKQLYGAMSQDMRRAADASDRTQAWVDTGPMLPSEQPAMQALNRANRYYSSAMDKVDALNGIANRDTPEGAFQSVANSLKSGPSVYERLRNAVTPETRQKVVATVVEEMGAATPGQQNADGSAWSPRTFLTNYNRLDPQARTELFKRIPNGGEYSKNLAQVAKVADMLGDGAKVWSNPSGTSQALVARGALGTIGAGVVGGIFYAPLIAPAAVAGGSLLLAHQVSQRLLLNPKFINWLAKVPPAQTQEQIAAYGQRLMMAAKMTNDPQFQQDTSDYLRSIGAAPNTAPAPLSQLPRKQ